MKECPHCKAQVPDIAHYCAKCGKAFGLEEAAADTAKAEAASGATIETRYVPGHAGIAIVKISGNCDSGHVSKLNMELNNLRNDKPKIVIFDLSGADGMCSMALSAIIAFVSDREDEQENSTALVNVRDAVMQAIDSLGISGMLPVYPDIKDALTSMQASQP
jgi:anti-anti-sigma factor